MTAGENKEKTGKQISEAQRFSYIGFEVFPGKPKDLFKSDDEKKRFVQRILERRQKGKALRDDCTLLEERVSYLDRMVLTVASVLIIVTLFLPWYSAYNEKVQESVATESVQPAAATDNTLSAGTQSGATEEVLHGYVPKKKVTKQYSSLSGLGAFLALGSAGSYAFSAGFAPAVTALLFLGLALLCLALPAYTLYGLYGLKGTADEKALKLKKILRFSWIPLIIFSFSLLLSFFGGEYGFDSKAVFTSLGNSYGPGVFLGTLSWGLLVALAASILTAAKGIEI